MRQNKRLIANILEIAIGVVLASCGYAGIVDEYWGGMGTALTIVGALMLARQVRYRTSESYKENVDVEVNDERNKYLRMKAWSWAGYIFVLIAALGTVIFKLMDLDAYSLAASGCVCLIIVLFWISYCVLRRKY